MRKFRVRKAAGLFVAEQGGSDFVSARGFTHSRHIEKYAAQRRVDASDLFDAVASHGLAIAHKWTVRYGREDGHSREITLSALTEEQAVLLADRRLSEQYGAALQERERSEQQLYGESHQLPEAAQIRDNPDSHQDNYVFESARRG